ncbi:MAG: precorrin-2 C(20)-methyltransferase [Albidovulum sp.]|nr:precorrin-2 C(20)-methyltransferase [Albidovulum sp.]
MGAGNLNGTLYGVGVGPGDPELMTIRAERLIRNAGVIAYPAPENGESFARSIAATSIQPATVEIPIRIPIQASRFPVQEIYDAASNRVSAHLLGGDDVVVICQGDPFFYGSFMYLFERLKDRFRVRVVPGVTSMTACAAAALHPLCARNESLTVLPATLENGVLEERIVADGAFAIVKVGRHLERIRKLLRSLGRESESLFIAHATLSGQFVSALADAPESAPYFSMILVPGTDPYAAS